MTPSQDKGSTTSTLASVRTFMTRFFCILIIMIIVIADHSLHELDRHSESQGRE